MHQNHLLFAVLLVLSVFLGGGKCADTLNVGTTLFSEADIYKPCWSAENIAILTTRMILEDLLPSSSVLSINSNEFINEIIEYFRLILEVVRKKTAGKSKHITLIALTDLLGGYLNHAVLPIAKYAYYAGVIDYVSIEKLNQLFDELKWFLRSNGQGWTKPMTQDPFSYPVAPIPQQPSAGSPQSCNGLVFYDGVPVNGEDTGCGMLIPLPFFDSKRRPCSIAVPFRAYSLRNIESKCSAYVVMKYYMAGLKCLLAKKASDESVRAFKNNLYTWINKEVMPKLDDDKFYAAFGGVLRVGYTLRKTGAQEVDLAKVMHALNQASEPKGEGGEEEGAGGANGTAGAVGAEALGGAGAGAGRGFQGCHTHDKRYCLYPTKTGYADYYNTIWYPQEHLSKKAIILMAMLLAICLWFLLGTIYICYRMRQSKDGKKDATSEPKSTDGKSTDDRTTSKGSLSGTSTSAPKSKSSLFGKCRERRAAKKAKSQESAKGSKKSRDSKSGEPQSSEGFDVVDIDSGKQGTTTDGDDTQPSDGPNEFHSYACHSSLTGDYATGGKPDDPYIFACDEFSSSEETTSRGSGMDTEAKSAET